MVRSFIFPAAAALALFSTGHGSLQETPPTIRETLTTGPDWVTGAAEPASGRFVAYSHEDGIRIHNRQTGKTISVPIKLALSFGGTLSMSRTGRRLVFPAWDDADRSHIWTVDLDTLTGEPVNAPHRISVVSARMASISGDGRWIALVANDKNVGGWGAGTRLLVMPSDGGDERMLDGAASIRTPRWSPDGQTLFYARHNALARIAFGGGRHDSLGLAASVIGVSADGKRVAFNTDGRPTQRLVQIVDFKGAVTGRFQINNQEFSLFGWSSATPSTFLGARLREPARLATTSLTDSATSPFPISESYPVEVHYSPDGSRLAMIARPDGRDQLIIYDLKSRQRRVIATPVQPEHYAWHWSPDGSRIAFLGANPVNQHHELHVVEVVTGHVTRLADLRSSQASNATLYRWRSDGRALDFILGTSRTGKDPVGLYRVTLAGTQSLVRLLPGAPQGNATDGGYQLINDTLVVIGTDSLLRAVPVPKGEPRILADHPAYWAVAGAVQLQSPDGKWIALGSVGRKDGARKPQWAIVSTDGTTFRLLGAPMGCDAWPTQWLPDSRSLLAVGAPSCDNYSQEHYIVPVDGSPARHLSLPPHLAVTLTPDGSGLLVLVAAPKTGSLVTVAPGSGRP